LFIGAPPGWPADFGESVLSENVVLYGMWAPSISEVSDVSAHFYEAYVEKWNEEPATYFAPLGYTAVYFVAEGIKNAGTLDKDALIAALAEVVLEETAIGEKLTIKPSNNITHQGFTDQKILQWQGGEQQVIWPFDLATAELVYSFQFGG
jgi:branched-chain amino acid transport system substrate-binding protein